MGRTSLETIPNSTFDRDFAQVKEDYEKAKAEAAKK
jgi:hypothetical protein